LTAALPSSVMNSRRLNVSLLMALWIAGMTAVIWWLERWLDGAAGCRW